MFSPFVWRSMCGASAYHIPMIGRIIFIGGLVLGFIFHEISNNDTGTPASYISAATTAVALAVGLPWCIISSRRRRRKARRSEPDLVVSDQFFQGYTAAAPPTAARHARGSKRR